MKKLIHLLPAIAVVGAVALGVSACERTIEPVPEWVCHVFVKTIPGEETILLAKSGLNGYEGNNLLAEFESQYGKGNIRGGGAYHAPYRKGSDGIYRPIYGPGITPNCYEVTMIMGFTDTPPPISDFYSRSFAVVKIDGNTAIGKYYGWALEEDAEDLIPRVEGWNRVSQWASDSGGVIISATIKNLGTEVYNMPIEF